MFHDLSLAIDSGWLKVETNERRSEQLLLVQSLTLAAAGRVLLRNLSFTVTPGDRIAVWGRTAAARPRC